MTPRARHDRTVRLLTSRLEAIALAAERTQTPRRELEPSVLRAAAATRNAVDLELLTPAEAGAIWGTIAERHPGAQLAALAVREESSTVRTERSAGGARARRGATPRQAA